jgi:hypothetical protein
MTDEQPLPPAERPGNTSSEFRLTMLSTLAGLAMVILGIVFDKEALSDNGTLIVLGAVGGYTVSRSLFKSRTVSK